MSQSDLSEAGRNGHLSMTLTDPEVPSRARRRHFSPEYKKRILEEADACTQRGQIGALLRRGLSGEGDAVQLVGDYVGRIIA